MSSLQDLAAEYGIDIDEIGFYKNEVYDVHSMDWVYEDLPAFLDYPSLRSGTRSHRVILSIRT